MEYEHLLKAAVEDELKAFDPEKVTSENYSFGDYVMLLELYRRTQKPSAWQRAYDAETYPQRRPDGSIRDAKTDASNG